MKTRNHVWKTTVCAGVLLFVAGWLAAAPYVILRNGKKYEGEDIRKMRNGDVKITRKGTGDQFTFTEDQVKEAVADKPREFDSAVKAVQKEKYDLAIEGLEEIVKDYRGLSWDVKAMPYLARAYVGKEQLEKALNTFQDMYERDPELKSDSKLSLAYCDVLLEAGKMATLEKKLDEMISEGKDDREAAARAQLMRGNVEMSKEDYKDAAKDYLRTVYFFRKIESVMPEATYKLAEALKKMRDKRAEKWYRTVAENYPGTEYARKAKNKL